MLRKGGLTTMVIGLGDLMTDLDMFFSLVDQRRARGNRGQVVADALKTTVTIINAQAKGGLSGREDQQGVTTPADASEAF